MIDQPAVVQTLQYHRTHVSVCNCLRRWLFQTTVKVSAARHPASSAHREQDATVEALCRQTEHCRSTNDGQATLLATASHTMRAIIVHTQPDRLKKQQRMFCSGDDYRRMTWRLWSPSQKSGLKWGMLVKVDCLFTHNTTRYSRHGNRLARRCRCSKLGRVDIKVCSVISLLQYRTIKVPATCVIWRNYRQLA